MIRFDERISPEATRGLQAMMLRWEQLQPVNAVHVAWLQNPYRPSEIVAATARALQRLVQSNCGRLPIQGSRDEDLFEFRHADAPGDWPSHLQAAVTNELNTPFSPGKPPIRISAFNLPRQQQFLLLAYRHVIADARSIALLMHEINHYLTTSAALPPALRAMFSNEGLDQLFPAQYRWRQIPAVAWNLVTELWKSLRCTRPLARNAADLRMEFRLHQTALPLGNLRNQCRQTGGTFNDLVLAAMLEWFAREYPCQMARRHELAVATLADLSGRAATPRPQAFGQYLTSFAVRAPVTAQMPFEDIVRLVVQQTQSCKRLAPLLLNARGFEFLAREWDAIPFARRPGHLPAVLPLMAGLSNVNLPGIVGRTEQPVAVRNYFRGTCVTNLLPMMLSITTLGETCSLTSTHRPAMFTAEQMDDLAAHVGCRLFGERRSGEQTAERREAA